MGNSIQLTEVSELMKSIAECDAWLDEFRGKTAIHAVWSAAYDGVMRRRMRLVEQLEGRTICVEVV